MLRDGREAIAVTARRAVLNETSLNEVRIGSLLRESAHCLLRHLSLSITVTEPSRSPWSREYMQPRLFHTHHKLFFVSFVSREHYVL